MRCCRLLPCILTAMFLVCFIVMALRVLPDRTYPLQDMEQVKTVSEFVCEMNGTSRVLVLPKSMGPLPPRTPVTLFAKIHTDANQSLYVKSVYAPLRLYANDVLIYESGQPGDFPEFLIDPATRVAIVPLPHTEATVQLRLEYLSPIERNSLALHPLLLGTDMSILQELVRKNGPSLIFAFILLFIGSLLTLMALVNMRGEPEVAAFFWLGLFALATGIWVFGECNLTVFFVPYPSFLYLLSFIGLFTVSLPLIRLGLVLPNLHHKLPLQIMSAVLLLCTTGALVLQGMGLVALSRSMYLFHILTPLSLSLLSVCMVWEGYRYRNVIAWRVAVPVVVLTTSSIVELLNYHLRYFAALSSITISFQMGALLFVLILSVIGGAFLRDSRRMRAEKQRMELELGLMERSVRMQKTHYADLNDKIDAAIRYRHDERHHLQLLYNSLLKKSEAAFFKEVWRKRGFAKPTEILLSLFVKFPVADSRRLHSPFFNGLIIFGKVKSTNV